MIESRDCCVCFYTGPEPPFNGPEETLEWVRFFAGIPDPDTGYFHHGSTEAVAVKYPEIYGDRGCRKISKISYPTYLRYCIYCGEMKLPPVKIKADMLFECSDCV